MASADDAYAFWLGLLITAAHGHERLVAKVVVASPDLRHDAELLSYVLLVASPAHAFCGGTTLFTRAVARGDVARVAELLGACPTPAARAALLAARDERGAPPLALAGTADMARFLLGQGAVAQAAGGGDAVDVLDAVVRAGRLGVLEVLLESLPSDEARRERLARVVADGDTLLSRAQHVARDQAPVDHVVQRHAPATLQLVMRIAAVHGHERLVSKVVVASPDLRHDAELLSYVLLVASPAHAFCGGTTLFTRAVARGDVARVAELLGACPTPAARAALLAARDERGAPPLALAGTADMARFLLGQGAVAQAAGGGDAVDVLDAVVRAGRLGVLEVLLESLPSDEARRERLARVDASSGSLLWQARKRSVAQALLDAGAILAPPQSAPAADLDDAYPAAHGNDDDDDDETGDDDSDDGARAESMTDDFFAGWILLDALTPGGSVSRETDVLAAWAALMKPADTESIPYIELDEDALSATLAAALALRTKAQRQRRVNLADEAGVTLLMRVAHDLSEPPTYYGDPPSPQHTSRDYRFELFAAGADVYAVDDCGRDAFDYAELLHDESDLRNAPLFIEDLLFSPGSKRVRRLRVNRRDRHGRTFLMRAQSTRVAESLVRAGASPWGVDRDGHDALWHALEDESGWGIYAVVPTIVKAMKATVRRRQRVNAADDHGLTPLMRATNDEAAEALITAGADPLAVDNDGNDAFWHASNLGPNDRRMVAIEMLKAVGSRQQRRLIREQYNLGAYWNDGQRD